MLVLTRKPKQGITIELEDGRRIFVKILSIKNQYYGISLGVDAPKTINVFRDELENDGKVRYVKETKICDENMDDFGNINPELDRYENINAGGTLIQ